MFGNPETTTGGKALKFYTSIRLDIRRIAQIKKGDEVMGGRVRVKVVKNKVAAPFKQTEFDLMYNEGISREGEIIALGEKFGIIKNQETHTNMVKNLWVAVMTPLDNSSKKIKKSVDNILKEIKEKLAKGDASIAPSTSAIESSSES